MIADGIAIKVIAAAPRVPAAVVDATETVFIKLAAGVSAGQ